DAETVATDLRWVGARLEQSDSPAAPSTDLARIGTPRAARRHRALSRAAHLLAPTTPAHARLDILYSRVMHDPDWATQARSLAQDRTLPGLINQWPLPDLPDPAVRRILTGHTGGVRGVAVAPDGSWLASVGFDGSVWIWDVATGAVRAR